MFLGCGCLIALLAGVAPRAVIILAWLFSDRWDLVWDTWIWPLLGFIFLPYTTIMYILVWNIARGISGWDWMWIGLGLLMDLMKWAQIAVNRREIPYYPETAY
jgi:hypothetical protein